jgi:site-specific DNA-methyltransferase (adenine-specific)
LEVNKIYNEDCRDGLSKLEENSIDLVITSPPYNVQVPYNAWKDSMPVEEYLDFTRVWLGLVYRALKPDGRIALNIPYESNYNYLEWGRCFLVAEYWHIMKSIGYKFAGVVDLKEEHPQHHSPRGSWMSPSAPYIYNPKECVVIAYKEQWKKNKQSDKYFVGEDGRREYLSLLYGQWPYKAETKKYTQANFSLDIPTAALKMLSWSDDLVVDPFMGSGTTAVACKMLKRNYIGFEISPEYVAISEERLNSITENGV